jgi:hypothetical protein
MAVELQEATPRALNVVMPFVHVAEPVYPPNPPLAFARTRALAIVLVWYAVYVILRTVPVARAPEMVDVFTNWPVTRHSWPGARTVGVPAE